MRQAVVPTIDLDAAQLDAFGRGKAESEMPL
jgi:hypothetical protein